MKQNGRNEAKASDHQSAAVGDDEWSDPRDKDSDNGTGFFTPPQFVSPEQHQPQAGVPIPALLQSLFGLGDFLPAAPISAKIEEGMFEDVDSYQQCFEGQEHEHELDLDVVLEQPRSMHGSTEDDDAMLLGADTRTRRKFRGQRIKKAFGTLKNRVQEAKGRRQSHSGDTAGFDSTLLNTSRGSSKRSTTPDKKRRSIPNASKGSSTGEAPWVQEQRGTLQQHKANLSNIQREASAVQSRVEEICDRLRSSEDEIAKLERLLATSVKQVQEDAVALDEAKQSLSKLERKRNVAEHALNDTALVIRNRIGGASIPSSVDSRSAGRNDETPRTPKSHNSSSTKRSSTDPPRDVARRGRGSTMDYGAMSKKVGSFDGTEISSDSKPPARARASSVPNVEKLPNVQNELKRVNSSFIRVHDLDMTTSASIELSDSAASSDTSQVGLSIDPPPDKTSSAKDPFFSIDQDVGSVLNTLIRFGYNVLTDESPRFRPLQNTERILAKGAGLEPPASWPVHPWNSVAGEDILVWTGAANHHGPGKDLPVIKARGIVPATPEAVMDLLLDSSRVGEYNKMSQGRSDLLYLQQGLNTTAAESDYGIAGEAKIIQALNRPPVIRRNIEMMTLIYARAIAEGVSRDSSGSSYISVSRSVWEDETGVAKTAKDTVRSEMLLGVTLARAVKTPDGQCQCELTTITHVQTSAVPEMLAKRMGPSHAVGYIKEIQQIFLK